MLITQLYELVWEFLLFNLINPKNCILGDEFGQVD